MGRPPDRKEAGGQGVHLSAVRSAQSADAGVTAGPSILEEQGEDALLLFTGSKRKEDQRGLVARAAQQRRSLWHEEDTGEQGGSRDPRFEHNFVTGISGSIKTCLGSSSEFSLCSSLTQGLHRLPCCPRIPGLKSSRLSLPNN